MGGARPGRPRRASARARGPDRCQCRAPGGGRVRRYGDAAAVAAGAGDRRGALELPQLRRPRRRARGARLALEGHVEPRAADARRAGRRDHPVERPVHALHVEDRAGARGRLHGRAQAGRVVAAVVLAAGGPRRRGGPSARRAQRRAGDRRGGRRGARRPTRAARISFTGSTETARQIGVAAAANVVPFTAELGGKNPLVVFDDADLDSRRRARRASTTTPARCACPGPGCSCRSRWSTRSSSVFTRTSMSTCSATPATTHDDLADDPPRPPRARRGVRRAGPGRGPADRPRRPPSRRAVLRADADRADAQRRRDRAERGVRPGADVPDVPDEDEAVALANSTRYGLSGIVFTSSMGRADRIGRAIRSGVVWVNTFLVRDLTAPFGGIGRRGHRPRGRRLRAGFLLGPEDPADPRGLDALTPLHRQASAGGGCCPRSARERVCGGFGMARILRHDDRVGCRQDDRGDRGRLAA